MGNWNSILEEINESPSDRVRRKYLAALHALTGRNTLCYYSGWLQKTGPNFSNVVSITDDDKTGFMTCFHEMDFSKGLDLLVHSPGGYVTATESLIHYIRSKFASDVRVFVPQLAMSGGTILALCGKEIWMGRQSNLGPIDPQFGNIPAVVLLEEVELAISEIKQDPARIEFWRPVFAQIAPSFLSKARQAIDLSLYIAKTALLDGMLQDRPKATDVAHRIVQELTNVATHKQHDRHIHKEDCEAMGLTIRSLEDNADLQEAVLSTHHAFMITLSNGPTAKIIENHLGRAFVKNVPQKVLLNQG